ncbi:hypothetical protein FGG78_25645 [Thioclava sp. BHET1]|nr:hypothetical protein FGG78_25645 [Thioclava sp. BHET1]
MRVYYTPEEGDASSGPITHTLDCEHSALLARLSGSYIEVDAIEGELSAYAVQAGALVLVDLSEEKSAAINRINAASGAARLQFVTSLPGQDMIYLRKEQEAISYLAQDPAPADLTDYPLLAAEVGITASTAYQLAQLWLNMKQIWTSAAAEIEKARMQAADEINAATTVADIQAVVASFSASAG